LPISELAVRFRLFNQLCADCILRALTFSVTPRLVIVFAACAAMASAATVFMSIDLFIFYPSPPAYWSQCLPPPLASNVPVLVVEIECLKISQFDRRTHLTGSLSVVTNLPMLVSWLPAGLI
jgi:hypothetical protein